MERDKLELELKKLRSINEEIFKESFHKMAEKDRHKKHLNYKQKERRKKWKK